MKSRKKIIVILVIFIIAIIFLDLSIKKITTKKADNQLMNLNFKSRVSELENFDSKDYSKIGWLQVQGTTIDLPILDFRSATDNSINYSYAWLNSNYNTGENRQVINGHNILNVSSTPLINDENLTDFEPLMAYAVGFYDYLYDSDYSYNDKEKLTKYINDVRENSIYDYEIDVNSDDDLIVLKTCTRYFGATEKQSFTINARKLRKNEEIVKYKVTTNKLFDELLNNSKKG